MTTNQFKMKGKLGTYIFLNLLYIIYLKIKGKSDTL